MRRIAFLLVALTPLTSTATECRTLLTCRADCERGDGMACIFLGQNFDSKQAARWLPRAAQLFEAGCKHERGADCYWLGIAYERGVGVVADQRRALAEYQRACTLGHVPGCTNAAGQVFIGRGTAKDLPRAATMYAAACDAGDRLACYWLGHIVDGELGLGRNMSHVGVVKNGDVEVRVLGDKNGSAQVTAGPVVKALMARPDSVCDDKHPDRCWFTGVRALIAGKPADAVTQMQRACTLGSGWGCLSLGDLTLRGIGITRDLGAAAGHFRKACEGAAEGFEEECNHITERMGL
jgi:TPR repeat protein